MEIEHGGNIYDKHVEVDFSVNVNPLPLPREIGRALEESLKWLHAYPDMDSRKLREALAEARGLEVDRIVVGNGASELMMGLVHSIRPRKALLPVPSFGGYERALEAVDCEVIYYPLRREDGFRLQEEILSRLEEEVDILFLANPNNPTGMLIDGDLLKDILDICQQKKIFVVVDECFLELASSDSGSCGPDVAGSGYPHLITLHAFTKSFALPGIRLGYMVAGSVALAHEVRRQLPEWNVSVPAQMAGLAALKVGDIFLETSRTYLAHARGELAEGLRELGLEVWDGRANFLLLYSELPLYESLLEQGILIRDCSNFPGLGKGFYRVAVKTVEDNKRLLEALAYIQKEQVVYDKESN